MPKAPPRPYTPPAPLPRSIRVYAHLHGDFDVACPACHTMHAVGKRLGKQRQVKHHSGLSGYDDLTGVLVCRGCQRAWYLGVVCWPITTKGRGRPEDHVPTREEAADLRMLAGGAGKLAGERRPPRAAVNLVCICGMGCPAHPEDGEVRE